MKHYLTGDDPALEVKLVLILIEAVEKLRSNGKEKTLEIFKKLGKWINAHMNDYSWQTLIHESKLLVDYCQPQMKDRSEGFWSFRLRIS